jgi:hypothetical protein
MVRDGDGERAARGLSRVRKAETRKIWELERPPEIARDVAKGIGAFVSETIGVRRSADSEGVEHKQEGAAHVVSGPNRSRTGEVFAGAAAIT